MTENPNVTIKLITIRLSWTHGRIRVSWSLLKVYSHLSSNSLCFISFYLQFSFRLHYNVVCEWILSQNDWIIFHENNKYFSCFQRCLYLTFLWKQCKWNVSEKILEKGKKYFCYLFHWIAATLEDIHRNLLGRIFKVRGTWISLWRKKIQLIKLNND